MRTAAKVDANQGDIVKALRRAGATVQMLHTVGDGCPDLLVGFLGKNTLMEVKDGAKPASARRLTPDQVEWHEGWNGDPVYIVCSPEQALAAVGMLCR
jgi:hypothetical protein